MILEGNTTVDGKMTVRRLAQKVQWEGGVLDALQYGIRADEIDDPDVSEAWRKLESLWAELESAAYAMELRLLAAAQAVDSSAAA
jgi:hypothetical protein